MTPLDPLTLELSGVRLIEASAGTGKTHTIATLFVRLVLERKLTVDQILVVTFTNAATAELRDRIRRRLRDALNAFEHGAPADPVLSGLVLRSNNRVADQRRLVRALSAVDEAGVLTIHGFCQRILVEHAFDGGVRSDLELLADIQPLVTEIVQDFWTRRFECASRAEVEFARRHGLGAKDLIALGVLAARLPDAPVVVTTGPSDVAGELVRYFAARDRMRTDWAQSRGAVLTLLLGATALHGTKYSEKACHRMTEAMDALVAAAPDSIDGFTDDIVKLSTSGIRAGTNKNKISPTHPSFTVCEELVEARSRVDLALGLWVQGLELELARHVREELPERLGRLSAQSFDDVLHALRDALRGPRRRALSASIRRRFPAALIDEFHDTDPVQYEIFRTIYRTKGTSLFLIGDPKQAIYAFRGADVFAYLSAAKDADSHATLATNYRSDPTLVRAVNAIFSASPSPFLLDEIRFEPVGTPEGAEDRLRHHGEPASNIEFVVVPDQEPTDGRRGRSPTPESIPEVAAAEIVRALAPATGLTLKDRAAPGGFRALEPGDFAVLTRTNAEGHEIQRALRDLGVPSVLHGDTSVLDTEEAADMGLLLQALADPANATAVRSALATTLLGLDASELFRLGDDEDAWEAWTNDFAAWHGIWKRRGFLAAMRQLLRDRRAAARLLRTIGGERKLTNLIHLTELCHRQAMDQHLGMAGLLSWFSEVRHDDAAREGMAAESQQIRLESDERAVQLTTMHRSKGLEYPVVVLPSLWKSVGLWDSELHRLRFHDPARANELVLDLRPEAEKKASIAHAEEESLAEGLRLLYVALTRARHRTIAIWGRFRGWQGSALARLVHPVIARGGTADALDDGAIRRDLAAISLTSGGAIQVRSPDEAPASGYRPPKTNVTDLKARAAVRRLSTTFRTSSFSALTAGAAAVAAPDDERDVEQHATSPLPSIDTITSDDARVALDDFPKGPRAGDVLHAILENTDFARGDPNELPRLVNDTLRRHGFDAPRFGQMVTDALADALQTPLSRDVPTLMLGNVARSERLSEMEFTFPAAETRSGRPATPVTAAAIAAVLSRREGNGLPRGYASRVAALDFAPLAGFLRGFIDLVFEHRGRFYLVDYKSNHLGSHVGSYAPEALVAPMAHHHYFLQYHLYLVALHRYLATRVVGYDYDRHVGGVAYLFLRGMTKERGPETGVFFDLPPAAAIEELSRTLSGATRRKS